MLQWKCLRLPSCRFLFQMQWSRMICTFNLHEFNYTLPPPPKRKDSLSAIQACSCIFYFDIKPWPSPNSVFEGRGRLNHQNIQDEWWRFRFTLFLFYSVIFLCLCFLCN
jgi:hypothetical protein